MPGPFDLDDLDDVAAYTRWREWKLDTAPRCLEDILIEVGDPRRLSATERRRFIDLNARCNMAIYVGKTGSDPDKDIPRLLGKQLGLETLDDHWLTDGDGISPLSVIGAEQRGERKDFIPYTDKPIRWHTDGYYNPPARTIRGLILHCVQSAASGGGNQLLDHELLYLMLRDESPALVRALFAPDAMTIPAREDENGIARAAQTGSVFSVNVDGSLHMRYTARTVSILWRQEAATQAAVAALAHLLATPTPWMLHGRLEPGMGLVCNNVLHDRSGFAETPERRRLLYRARYHERVAAN